MCFAPQRRAIFPDRDLQNGSDHEVFCTFWRTNVLRATAACHFSGSQLPKWLRSCGVLYILTYKCASRHSGVQFFRTPLSSYLRTRRFYEATFRTAGTTNHWKNTAIRDVANISRTCIFWIAVFWSRFQCSQHVLCKFQFGLGPDPNTSPIVQKCWLWAWLKQPNSLHDCLVALSMCSTRAPQVHLPWESWKEFKHVTSVW